MSSLLVALLPFIGSGAMAQSVVSGGQSFVSGRLLPGTRHEDGSRLAGLRLTLKDGWKTYWRSPGEAGIPPQFDWSGSKNLASVRIFWPKPEVFVSFGMQTIGYANQVVLPILVTPVDPAKPIRLSVTADLGVCKEICVLEQFKLTRLIPIDERPIGAGQIRRAWSTVPPSGEAAGLHQATCRISGSGRDRQLRLQLSFTRSLEEPFVIIEGGKKAWVSKVVSRLTAPGTIAVEARLSLASETAWVTRQDLRMTVLAGNLTADIQGCRAPAG